MFETATAFTTAFSSALTFGRMTFKRQHSRDVILTHKFGGATNDVYTNDTWSNDVLDTTLD